MPANRLEATRTTNPVRPMIDAHTVLSAIEKAHVTIVAERYGAEAALQLGHALTNLRVKWEDAE